MTYLHGQTCFLVIYCFDLSIIYRSFGDKSPIPVIPDGMLMMNEDSDSDENEQSSSPKMDQQNGDSKVTKVTGDSGIDSRLNANQSCNSGDNCEIDQAMNKCSESLHQLDLKNGSNNTEEEMMDLLGIL